MSQCRTETQGSRALSPHEIHRVHLTLEYRGTAQRYRAALAIALKVLGRRFDLRVTRMEEV
jgi:hypothetical protein